MSQDEYSEQAEDALIFFVSEQAEDRINTFSAFALFAGLLGIIAVLLGIVSLFVAKALDYIKYYGVLLFLAGLLIFVFGLMYANVETILSGANYSISIGTILAFIGGLVGLTPVILPIVIKQ
ncbi:MAG: hypothetical protein PHW00_00465 [Clostridia bacterium]|nr:hypothetical protein [Clostridia bacterium]